MSRHQSNCTRRDFMQVLAGLAAGALGIPAQGTAPTDASPLTRRIPTTGETLPALGMGTWVTFNVGEDSQLRAHRVRILRAFFENGGALIDSSPMYGSSEAVIGHCLEQLGRPEAGFSATKVWTWRTGAGPEQMAESRRLWGTQGFDLMQVHNLLSWRGHLETLKADKAEGRARYIGVTTSHGRRHDELERIMTREPIDFVQLTYNIIDRDAEQRLLPMAAERGLAVIINRPFRHKQLFHRYAHHPLPPWADEVGASTWAEFFLKFILSHPSVTCAIPATASVEHMRQNMRALHGRLPEARQRLDMVRYVERL